MRKKTHGVASLGIGALLVVLSACGSSSATPAPPSHAPSNAGVAPATTAPPAAGNGGEGSGQSNVSAGTGALLTHSGCNFQSKSFTVSTPAITVRYSYASTAAQLTSAPVFEVYLSKGGDHWVPADRIVEETGVHGSYHIVRPHLALGRYNVSVVSNAHTCTVTVVPGGIAGK